MDKKTQRIRRSLRARAAIRRIGAVRLCIHRTPRNMYAQVIAPNGATIITFASTLDPEVKAIHANGGNIDAAKEVGRLVAKRALELGVKKIAFDRSGFKYHGRVQALADAAREGGLEF